MSAAREDVGFDVAGDRIAAWLYRPANGAGDGGAGAACVVMAHGFANVRSACLPEYAERFAAEGLAVLVFDYRHFGDSEGEPRQLLDIGRQHADWRAAIAFARACEGVDPDRIGLWGTSFSGGHVIQLAAQDERIAAVVAQSPFTDGLAQMRKVSPRVTAAFTAAAVRDVWGQVRGRAPHMVPVVGPPGSVAALTSPGCEDCYREMLPPGAAWRNEVAARLSLRLGSYRPGRLAPKVRCPLLVCVMEHDQLTPVEPAVRVAHAAPKGELRRYPGDHFDLYFGETFERVAGDEAEFLARHLVGAEAPLAS